MRKGHHLSLSFTIVEGLHISATPSMMGTNPAIVPDCPHKGLQTLADEENIALELAKSLSTSQRAKAEVSKNAPADLVTGNRRTISPSIQAMVLSSASVWSNNAQLACLVKCEIMKVRRHLGWPMCFVANGVGRRSIRDAAGGTM